MSKEGTKAKAGPKTPYIPSSEEIAAIQATSAVLEGLTPRARGYVFQRIASMYGRKPDPKVKKPPLAKQPDSITSLWEATPEFKAWRVVVDEARAKGTGGVFKLDQTPEEIAKFTELRNSAFRAKSTIMEEKALKKGNPPAEGPVLKERGTSRTKKAVQSKAKPSETTKGGKGKGGKPPKVVFQGALAKESASTKPKAAKRSRKSLSFDISERIGEDTAIEGLEEDNDECEEGDLTFGESLAEGSSSE